MAPIRIALVVVVAWFALVTPAAARRPELRVPTPGPVTVVYGPVPGFTGTLGGVVNGTIYLDGDRSRSTLEHERGHVFDERRLDTGERNRIARLLGHRGEPWVTEEIAVSNGLFSLAPVSPSELFADAYANLRLRAYPGEPAFTYGMYLDGEGYHPTDRRHRRVAALIRRAAD